jgi:hypothetical protein
MTVKNFSQDERVTITTVHVLSQRTAQTTGVTEVHSTLKIVPRQRIIDYTVVYGYKVSKLGVLCRTFDTHAYDSVNGL